MSGSIRCKSHGGDDALVAAASADVAFHRRVDLVVRWLLVAGEQRRGRHDLAGLAITALRHAEFSPCLLDRMIAVAVETFDRDDGDTFNRRHRDRTGTDRVAIDMHGARAAKPFAASELGPGQLQFIAQVPEQRHRWIAIECSRLTIYFEFNHGIPPDIGWF